MEVCCCLRWSARKELATRQTVPDFLLGVVRFDCVIGEEKGRLELRGQDFRYGRVAGESTIVVGISAACAR